MAPIAALPYNVIPLLGGLTNTYCADFDGATGALDWGTGLNPNTTGVSWQYWLKFEGSLPGIGAVAALAKWNDLVLGKTERQFVILHQNAAGEHRVFMSWYDTGGLVNSWYWAWSPSPDVWYAITITLAAASSTASEGKLYINRSDQGASTVFGDNNANNPLNSITTVPTYIGARGSSTVRERWFPGRLDDVRIWSETLSQANINSGGKADQYTELNGTPSGLYAHARLEDLNTSYPASPATLTKHGTVDFVTDPAF